jgi:hypothetical protein
MRGTWIGIRGRLINRIFSYFISTISPHALCGQLTASDTLGALGLRPHPYLRADAIGH